MIEQAVFISHSQADKKAISESFSRAASTYDQHAEFQRQVGQHILERMPSDLTGTKVLDLGCGTGYFAKLLALRGAKVIAADLSDAMLRATASRCEQLDVMCELVDADALPFSDASFDFVFSSLALQWCEDLSLPLREIRRVLNRGGRAYFSTLLDGSLLELKNAWSKVDAYQHVNEFLTSKQVKLALAQAGCSTHKIDSFPITLRYRSALELMKDLKGIGASHVDGRAVGLVTKSKLIRVDKAYRQLHAPQGLIPATYQVCLGEISAC
ncbi:malonyl-[acyl-carrier protein] O-methyltransferase BioC [Vibrio sp. vnigr-6D03]|uniref:malonyl-ACP O-methyltransferase BioC n=1 Tax=Vibrio sp. vnigr-6D03 TaxID=2058088 RepID=UPI000C332B37|nr:malonyl-ACP O-methyltransferase BioC [Vibrio sp. vnigr-6D03]PKF79462.1 malonyl-[acyl-carrier protein] O-methyltransferase BioC [Vibrio sp. vnigr-6D03]